MILTRKNKQPSNKEGFFERKRMADDPTFLIMKNPPL
jgi:hypothetical protein